jgi:glycosyltransferase involved in cell wall biosynthesis
MANPLISVIVPVYNVETYLDTCINSITRQTYTNIEVLLIDDGSTDNSPMLCDAYAKRDSRFKVIHQHNHGLGAARNVGLDHALGQFIYFLDSDDWIEPMLLKNTVQRMQNEHLDMCFFEATVRNETNHIAWNPDAYSKSHHYKAAAGSTILQQQFSNNEYSSCVYLYMARRSLIQSNSIRFQENILFEDNVFTFRLALASTCCDVLPQRLYNRRIRSNSIMTRKDDTTRKIDSYKSVIDALHMIPVEPACRKMKNRYIYSCSAALLNIAKRDRTRWKSTTGFILSKYLFVKWKMPLKLIKESISYIRVHHMFKKSGFNSGPRR